MMVPLFIAGFTAKGKLELDIHTPSILVDTDETVSRRRDFVDILEMPSETIQDLSTLITERISHDIGLRKCTIVPLIIGGSSEIPFKEIPYCKTTDMVPTLLKIIGQTPDKSVVGKSLL